MRSHGLNGGMIMKQDTNLFKEHKGEKIYPPVIPKKDEIAEITWKINVKSGAIDRDVLIRKIQEGKP